MVSLTSIVFPGHSELYLLIPIPEWNYAQAVGTVGAQRTISGRS